MATTAKAAHRAATAKPQVTNSTTTNAAMANTATTLATTAAQFAAELRANVDAWYEEENTPATYAAFSARNGATWDRIRAAGAVVEDEVQRILRERR